MGEQTVSTVSPLGRWRITGDEPATVTGRKIEGEVSTSVTEFLVSSVEDGSAQVRVVRGGDNWGLASWQLSIAEKDMLALVDRSVREPDLLAGHNISGGYFNPGTALFLADPAPADVNQGQMGDCRVASAFQAIAVTKNGPALIRALFTGDFNGYKVTLRRTTGPKVVPPTTQAPEVFDVSGYLPVNRATMSPLYALNGATLGKTVSVSLWPAVLEKAFAQMWGGYTNLVGAEEMPVFGALGLTDPIRVNMMSPTFAMLGPDKAAKKIIAYAADGYALTTAAMSARHNYAVLAADTDGVLISDPNTTRTEEAAKRWKSPDSIKTGSTLPPSTQFPIRFGWEAFFDTFMWVYGAKVPAKK